MPSARPSARPSVTSSPSSNQLILHDSAFRSVERPPATGHGPHCRVRSSNSIDEAFRDFRSSSNHLCWMTQYIALPWRCEKAQVDTHSIQLCKAINYVQIHIL